ncbi:hypothetical protein [Roseibium alexandrii]|uniref:hypothetical protein n=1 Tax=Roseibium alexandrii TaxID=388408 RepID=UPI000A769AFB|nr:hypothetical protein [Roseibium alexandrii]
MSNSTKRFVALYFLGSCLIVLLGTLVPSGNGPVVVFAKPWGASALEVVAKADGRIMVAPTATWFALSQSADSDFVQRLYQSGAGFVASSAVAYACARITGTPMETQ